MIEAIEDNLKKGLQLLNSISEDDYKNTSVKPYNASIGTHIRHVMDMFDCVFQGLETGEIDLTARKRNKEVETTISAGKNYIKSTIVALLDLDSTIFGKAIYVSDAIGKEVIRAEYTVSAILIQAHSHAVHHYASIGYIIHQLGIELPDDMFGVNPASPKKEVVNSQ